MSLQNKEWNLIISGWKGTKYHKGFLTEDIKEFIRWVEEELILKNPKARYNLIKLKNRVGDKLI